MRVKKQIEEILCDECGQVVDPFCVICVEEKEYHPNCYSKLYTTCDDCFEDFPNDDIIFDGYSDRGLCKECVQDRLNHYKKLAKG